MLNADHHRVLRRDGSRVGQRSRLTPYGDPTAKKQ
jgi:hypothetical protein